MADRLFPTGAIFGQVFKGDQTTSCCHVSHLINPKIKCQLPKINPKDQMSATWSTKRSNVSHLIINPIIKCQPPDQPKNQTKHFGAKSISANPTMRTFWELIIHQLCPSPILPRIKLRGTSLRKPSLTCFLGWCWLHLVCITMIENVANLRKVSASTGSL